MKSFYLIVAVVVALCVAPLADAGTYQVQKDKSVVKTYTAAPHAYIVQEECPGREVYAVQTQNLAGVGRVTARTRVGLLDRLRAARSVRKGLKNVGSDVALGYSAYTYQQGYTVVPQGETLGAHAD